MTSAATIATLGARVLACAAVGWFLVCAYRAFARRSPVLGGIVAGGILLRAALGVPLFFVSYLGLPVLRSMQLGGGFWTLAPDARLYFNAAVEASDHGVFAIPANVPSPAFVGMLSWWMTLVGVGPAAAILFNLCAYVAVSWLIVREFGERSSIVILALLAFACSPALLLFGSQPLKDAFFALLVACSCAGARELARITAGPLKRIAWPQWGIAACTIVAFGLMAGIRPYFPVFLFAALAASLAVVAFRDGPRIAPRRIATAVIVLALAGASWAAGLGPYEGVYLRPLLKPLGISVRDAGVYAGGLSEALDRGRDAFVRSGGATNFGRRPEPGAGAWERAKVTGVGVLVILVPVTALNAVGIVSVGGSRATLLLVDLDTLFVDATLVGLIILLFRQGRRHRADLAYLSFTAVTAGLTLFAMGYVVTNFGTLWRLRLMLAVPLWMLPLAFGGTRGSLRSIPAANGSVAAEVAHD